MYSSRFPTESYCKCKSQIFIYHTLFCVQHIMKTCIVLSLTMAGLYIQFAKCKVVWDNMLLCMSYISNCGSVRVLCRCLEKRGCSCVRTFVMIPCSTSPTRDAMLVPFSTLFHSGKLITIEPLYRSGHLQI